MIDLNTISYLIGDTPVPEQLGEALSNVASKEHTHDEYANYNEVEDLKKKVEMLLQLVGDTSVADQIAVAINNIK